MVVSTIYWFKKIRRMLPNMIAADNQISILLMKSRKCSTKLYIICQYFNMIFPKMQYLRK